MQEAMGRAFLPSWVSGILSLGWTGKRELIIFRQTFPYLTWKSKRNYQALSVFLLTTTQLKNVSINISSSMLGPTCQHTTWSTVYFKPVKLLHYLNSKVLIVPTQMITEMNSFVICALRNMNLTKEDPYNLRYAKTKFVPLIFLIFYSKI